MSSVCSECFPAELSLRTLNLSQQTYSLLPTLARSLPSLQSININNFERSEAYLDGVDNLPLLQSFSKLHSLTLKDVEMDQIFNYFQTFGGSNIKTFRFEYKYLFRLSNKLKINIYMDQVQQLPEQY